jgi:superfamily II DNA helicase RecQ
MDAGITYAMGLQANPVSPEIQQQQHRRWEVLRNASLRQGLRQMFNDPSATFRGSQEEILQAIVQRRSPIVAIQATSFGKSLLFMLPAVMSPQGMTIVVVPLISLRDNMADRCRKIGIRCVEWHPHQPADGAQIVLITPEGTTSEAFQHFVNRQRTLGLLDRIVVDECHVILESVHGWRPKVRALIELQQHQTQLMYLTATIQPREEERFYRITGIIPEQVVRFRGSTTRPNIQYLVEPYESKQEDASIQAIVDQKRQQYPLPGQIIVYCAAVEQTKSVAELLGCSAYYRDIGNGDAQYKRQILDRLILGQEQVFVATNALGLGIDRGSIRVVIHIGVPRQMRAYAQESGRAGRDGLVSESIIMRPGKRDHGGRWVFPPLKDVEEDMQSFVETPGCRRVIIDHSMDGRENRMVCEEGEALCGNCVESVRRHTKDPKDPDHEDDPDMTLVEASPQTSQESKAEKEDQSNNAEGGTEKDQQKEEQGERGTENRRKRARVVSIVPGRPPPPPSTATVPPTQDQGSSKSHVSPFQIKER